MARALCLLAALALMTATAEAGETPHRCDLVASYPHDTRSLAPGVDDFQVDAPDALSACGQALERHPDHPRYQFLYGRALMLSGRTEEGTTYLNLALDNGYAAAPLYLAERSAGDPAFEQEQAAALYLAADRLGSSGAFALIGWRLVAFGKSEASVMAGYQLLEAAAVEGNPEAKATLGAHYFFHPRFAPDVNKRLSGKAFLAEAAAAGSARGKALLYLVNLEEDAYGLIGLDRAGGGADMIETIARAAQERRRDILIWAHHVVTNEDYHSDMIRRLKRALCATAAYRDFTEVIGDRVCRIRT